LIAFLGGSGEEHALQEGIVFDKEDSSLHTGDGIQV
jgi:hypothetical protein